MSSKLPNARPRLTVAMIVRNEASCLAATIESIKALAHQIVVLDTGSSDGTVELARALGATVVEHLWTDDFAAARNACWRSVTGDWLLWLDAGERLDPAAVEQLRDFIGTQADRGAVYSMMIELPATSQGASGEQIAQPRLMPNRPELRYTGRVRETVLPGVLAAGLRVELAPGRIYRDRRDHDPQRRAARARRNLALALKEGASTGHTPPRLLLAAGDAHVELGATDRACESYRAAADKAPGGSTELLEAYYGWLAAVTADPSRLDEQIDVCLRALEFFPLDAQLLLTMGNLMQRIERLDLATRAFNAAVQHGCVDLGTWHLADLPEATTACLAASLRLQDRDDEARRVLEEALSKGDSPRLLRQLLDLYVRQNCCREALALADRLPLDDVDVGPMHEAVQGACLAAAGRWTPALGHLQIAYLEGCRDPFCLRWLAATYLATGEHEAARPVLADWQRVEPDNLELQAYLAAVPEVTEAAEAADESAAAPTRASTTEGRVLRVDRPLPLGEPVIVQPTPTPSVR